MRISKPLLRSLGQVDFRISHLHIPHNHSDFGPICLISTHHRSPITYHRPRNPNWNWNGNRLDHPNGVLETRGATRESPECGCKTRPVARFLFNLVVRQWPGPLPLPLLSSAPLPRRLHTAVVDGNRGAYLPLSPLRLVHTSIYVRQLQGSLQRPRSRNKRVAKRTGAGVGHLVADAERS